MEHCGQTEVGTLTVRSRLASGVVHSTPWGIDLDGLLVSRLRDQIKAAARDAGVDYPLDDPTVVPDVLDRCTHAGDEDWHWALMRLSGRINERYQ